MAWIAPTHSPLASTFQLLADKPCKCKEGREGGRGGGKEGIYKILMVGRRGGRKRRGREGMYLVQRADYLLGVACEVAPSLRLGKVL